MTDKHHHKAKKHEEHEEDISDIEDSLFSDAANDEPEVGLIKKSHKSHSHASHSHAHHGRTKELRLSIPIPDRDLMVKVGVGLVILVLLVFFFYNPFYCKMSWNKDQCSIVDTEDDDEDVEVADEVDVTIGNEDEESDVEEESDVVDEEESDVEDDTDVEYSDVVDDDLDVVDLSGDITFDMTKLPDITAKDWGWQVEKVYFSVDNQQETFIPKIRIRVYEGTEQGTNMRSDTVKVYPALDVGKKLISSVEFIAMIGDLDEDAIIVMELKDEGDESGLAEDRLMKKITQTVKHPIS